MKTPEEAAREYASDNGFMHDEWRDIHNAFLAGIAFATRWISVEDKLPEPSVPYHEIYYLVKCSGWSDSDYSIASYNKEGEWISAELGQIMTKYVTHWKYIEQ